MKHSQKMINFLQNTEPKSVADLGFGCPECGGKFTHREGNVAVCINEHRVKL